MRIQAKERYKNAAGTTVPSVTTALNILAKPALIRWANRLGLEGIDMDRYKDELAGIGTLTHYLIMCDLREEIPDLIEFTPEQVSEAEKCYRKFTDWRELNPVKPILTETPLVSERYQFGGRPDLYALCRGDLLLADFKTSASGIFDEAIYQVATYYYLLIEAGYRVTKAAILRLGRTGAEGAEERILTKEELEVGFQIFLRCLDIYNLRRRPVWPT